MTRKVALVLLTLVLALSVGLVACGGAGEQEEERMGEQEEEEEEVEVEEIETWQPGVHGEVTFSQLEWMKSPREVLYPYSNVGEAEFTFLEGAGDWLLDEYGGGWINVVLVTQSGVYEWVVQNLYSTYDDMDYLLASKPSVQFPLGLDNETPIDEVDAAVFISSEPLEAQPEATELTTYRVGHTPYLVGGVDGEDSADSDIPWTIMPWIGSSGPPLHAEFSPAPVIEATFESIIPEIDVDYKVGCAPAAAARSIYWLGKVHGFETEHANAIYLHLLGRMHPETWSYDNPWYNGFFLGKDDYCADFGLNNIETEWAALGLTLDYQEVQDLMALLCDIEIKFNWSGGGAHMAMVTSITTHGDGSATIQYVDDPYQGDGVAENKWHVITVDKHGNFNKGQVLAFIYECYGFCPLASGHI